MSWRERMRPASFRGVPFHVDSAEVSGGRRTVTHEFPRRDDPFVEDMGRSAREFTVEGYVVGDGYMAARDALLNALEQAGPGELVHPYYGTRRVAVASYRVRESSADGGMARISVTFKETGIAPEFVVLSAGNVERVDLAGDAVVATLRAKAAAQRSVSLPSLALGSLSAMVASAAQAVGAALAPIVTGTQELASLKRQVDELVLDAASLSRSPAAALDGFLSVFESLGSTPVSRAMIDALLAAYGFEPATERPPATTSARLAEQSAYDLLLEIIRALTVVQAARLAPVADYDSYDEAALVRDAVAGKLDELSAGADDDTFAALEQLRADLMRAVPGEESDLPRLARHTPLITVPSLVLAHRLYGDLDREADIVARNRLQHPGFIVGGSSLEVLSDD